ncbi:MAG: preprotein translocase subunit SecG [Clostridia bacterium]|nr:preprotein translocase subunit SecG [Clostridia bacterium]
MQTALIIIQVIISVILIITVLMQSGKQQGLSGAIAGGAETFFGKNKGRTIDGVLKKVTTVVAVLFVISSIALATYAINKSNAEQAALEESAQEENAEQIEAGLDENGNLVDADGNILMTAEDLAASQAQSQETETAE